MVEGKIDMLGRHVAKKLPWGKSHVNSSPKPEVFEFRMILWSIVDIDFRHDKYNFDEMTHTKSRC